MIIQKGLEAHQVIAISQTAHAWVSGQLARQWGNECFPDFTPVEPLCYAAEQHDRGFLDWERQPTLNPKSGLPHTFEDIPLSLHVELRKRSILELKAVSRFGLLELPPPEIRPEFYRSTSNAGMLQLGMPRLARCQVPFLGEDVAQLCCLILLKGNRISQQPYARKGSKLRFKFS
jgi:Protein of unknown function (DUF3891)